MEHFLAQDYKICSEPKRQSQKALRRRENQHPSSPISTANAKGAWLILCPDTCMIILIPFHTAVVSTSTSDKIMLAKSPADKLLYTTLHNQAKCVAGSFLLCKRACWTHCRW